MALTPRNNLAIAQVVLFIPILLVALFLCTRHGFKKNAGWLILVIFALVRLVGASLLLATISDPTNTQLYTIALVLQSIGLSFFLTVLFALLSRVLESIHKARAAILPPIILRAIHLLIVASIVLGAIGGSKSASSIQETGTYTPSNLSQISVIVTIIVFIMLIGMSALIAGNISYAEPGENRALLAVALSLPFLLVRIIYSAVSIFGHNAAFNQLTGSIGVMVGTDFVPELIIVLIVEGIGLTLPVQADKTVSGGIQRQGTYSRVSGPPVPDHDMHQFNQRNTAYV